MKRIALLLISVLALTTMLSAQDLNSPKVKSQIQIRATQKVDQLNSNISSMADKDYNRDERMYFAKAAKKLFIANCEDYYDYEARKNVKGVTMEVTSRYRKSVNKILMRNYFTHMVDLKYTDVEITSSDIASMKVSNPQRISENTFVCTVQFDQAFVGYRDGRAVYKDITTKRVKCYIDIERTEAGDEYIVRLGNTSAIATKPYN